MWSFLLNLAVALFKAIFPPKSPAVVEAEQEGAATQKAADASTAAVAITAEAQAEADAPKTDAAIDKRLSDGTF